MEKENLINSLVLNLVLTDEKYGNGFVVNSDELYNDYFLPSIDDVVSRLGIDYDADVDDVTVDLGVVNIEDLPGSLSDALEKALLKKLNALSRISDSEGSVFVENDVLSRNELQLFMQLPDSLKNVSGCKEIILFLFTGESPWQIELADFHPDEWLLQMLSVWQNDVSSLKVFLSAVAADDVAFSRFQGLLDVSRLRELCVILLNFAKTNHEFDGLPDNHLDEIDFRLFFSHCDKVVSSGILRLLSRNDKSVAYRILSDCQEANRVWSFENHGSLSASYSDVPLVEQERLSEYLGNQRFAVEQNRSVFVEMETAARKDDAGEGLSETQVVGNDRAANRWEDGFSHDNENNCGNKSVPIRGFGQNDYVGKENQVDFDAIESDGKVINAEKANPAMKTAYAKMSAGDDGNKKGKTQWESEFVFQLEKNTVEMKERLANQFVPIKSKLMVDDAGLVLLHPFLPTLFSRTGLLDEENKFKDLTSKEKAAHFLRFSSGDVRPHFDHLMNLEKMFCGLPVQYPLTPDFPISDSEKMEINDMLESVCQHWKPLNGTSVAGLQQSFLRRNGNVSFDDGTWLIRVEGMTVDILMDDLPWEISTILFPWTEDLFVVDWQRNY